MREIGWCGPRATGQTRIQISFLPGTGCKAGVLGSLRANPLKTFFPSSVEEMAVHPLWDGDFDP